MKMKKLSKKAKTIWRIRCTLVAVLLAMITGGICAFSAVIAAIIGIVWLAAYFIAVILYIPIVYKMYEFDVTSEFLTIKKGLYFNKFIVVSTDKVLYIELLQSPLQKKLNIFSLVVHTAGSIVLLSQIDHDDAMNILAVVKKSKEKLANEAKEKAAQI